MAAYVGLLAVSLAFGWTQRFGVRDEPRPAAGDDDCGLTTVLVLEAVHIVLTVAALLWVRPRSAAMPASPGKRAAAWGVAVPMLALAMGINLGYHRFLREVVHLPILDDAILDRCGWSATLIVALCVQPAIFEELFFRHVVLDTFRGPAGVHTAVLVSSAMFGFAHIGTPLSIPTLTVLGLALGYARVLGGSLALPMLMHFVHNVAVLSLAGGR
jgi:membrane protease YdiL (CAAX protease family)